MYPYGIIADYFIWKTSDVGSLITNLKLQKLLYYTQAWYITLYGEPLIEEDLEAWVHGPAIPECYREYKKFAWHPINKKTISRPQLSPKVVEHLEEIANIYMIKDAYELELLSHSENPWIQARNGLPLDKASHNIVKLDDMKKYYSLLLNDSKES